MVTEKELERDELDSMSLVDHLEELRKRITISAVSVILAFFGCWAFARQIFDWMQEPIRPYLPDGITLAYTDLVSPFMLYVKVALLAAIFAASPIILSQLWLFLRPGLYPSERRIALPFIFFTSTFFLSGGYFGYRVAFPMVAKFLIGVGEGFLPVITIQSYFAMLSKILLGLGLCFEMPILIFFLARIGLVTARQLIAWFRWAVLVIFIVAAIITPTPDIATQTVFAVPMLLLYILGIGVAAVFGKKRLKE